MKIREVMTRNVRCVKPDTSIKEAAIEMQQLDVGALPICDGDRLTGMVTDRDIVVRCVAKGMDPGRTQVKDAMTEHLTWCREDDDVQEAAKLMQDKQIRRLPIVDKDKRLVGIVSLGDVATREDRATAGEAVKDVSKPGGPHTQSARI